MLLGKGPVLSYYPAGFGDNLKFVHSIMFYKNTSCQTIMNKNRVLITAAAHRSSLRKANVSLSGQPKCWHVYEAS